MSQLNHLARERVVTIVLSSIAVTVLVITDRYKGEWWGDLLSRFGFALLVAVVTRFTLVYLYQEDRSALEKFREHGMEELHYPLTDHDIQQRLSQARNIDVLKTWFPESPEIARGLQQAVMSNKANVRLALCQPGGRTLELRSEGAGLPVALVNFSVYNMVKDAREWLLKVPDASIEIRLYDIWPGCPVIWYGKEGRETSAPMSILMGFYFRGAASPRWPWIAVASGSPLGETLRKQFQDIWGRAAVRLSSPSEMETWLSANQAHSLAQ